MDLKGVEMQIEEEARECETISFIDLKDGCFRRVHEGKVLPPVYLKIVNPIVADTFGNFVYNSVDLHGERLVDMEDDEVIVPVCAKVHIPQPQVR